MGTEIEAGGRSPPSTPAGESSSGAANAPAAAVVTNEASAEPSANAPEESAAATEPTSGTGVGADSALSRLRELENDRKAKSAQA